jgi:O-methyltransferase
LKLLASKLFGYKTDLVESCFQPEKRQALLYYLNNSMEIPGDIIECGVYRAGVTLIMADALRSSRSSKIIHGFDSFEGMPEALNQDALPTGKIVYHRGVLSTTSLALVMEKIKVFGHQERVTFYQGFFQDVMPRVISDDARFSLVLIDCDQYAGAKFCLEFLYNKVNPGGMILIDDYFLSQKFDTPGVKIAVDEFLVSKPEADKLEHLALSLYGFKKA